MEKMKDETGTYAKRKRSLNGLTQYYQNILTQSLLNALDNFKTEDWTMSINDATPSEWDRLRKQAPALEPTTVDDLMRVYVEMSQAELESYMLDDEEEKEMSREKLAPYIVYPDDLISFTGYPEEEEEDVVNSPSHYNTGNIECIEAIEDSMSPAAFKGYLKGNCMKYLWRYDYKGKPVEDLKKAGWYLSRLIEMVEQQDNHEKEELLDSYITSYIIPPEK